MKSVYFDAVHDGSMTAASEILYDYDHHVVKLKYWLVEWLNNGDDEQVVKIGIDLSIGRALMTDPHVLK